MPGVLVDSTILAIIVGSLSKGYRGGLLRSLVGLVGFPTLLALCLSFGDAFSAFLQPLIPVPNPYAMLASYIAICLVIALAAYFAEEFLSRMCARKLPPALDSVGGMFVGGLRGAVSTALCLLILVLMASPDVSEKIRRESRLGNAFFREASKVSPTIDKIYTSSLSPFQNKGVVEPKSDYEEALDSFDTESRSNKER